MRLTEEIIFQEIIQTYQFMIYKLPFSSFSISFDVSLGDSLLSCASFYVFCNK